MSLKNKAVSGVKWNTIATGYCMLLQVLRLAVLTRLLAKADFGLVAIATMVISFTDIFSNLSVTVAIIHKQDITDKQYSSVYWLNVLISIALFLVVWALSPLLAVFYKQSELNIIIPLLGVQILFNAFGKMFQTIKTKNLEFAFISKVRIIANTLGFIMTIVLAYIGWRVYSLVVGQLFQVAINQLVYAFSGMKKQKILFHFNVREIKDFIKIGSYQLGASILDFFSAKIDIFLIGKFFNIDELGVYNLAKDLIIKPLQIIGSLINGVASSVFARLQNDIIIIKQNYEKLLKIVTTISIPIYIATFIFADFIVEILYSSIFYDVAIFLRILSVVGLLSTIDSIAGTLQVSLGRTDIGFKWTLVRVVMSITVILISSNFSIIVVAYGQVLVALISYLLYWRFAIYSLIKIKLLEYMKIISTSFLAALIIGVPFFLIINYYRINMISKAFFAIAYFVFYCAYYLLWHKDFVNSIFKLVVGNKIKK